MQDRIVRLVDGRTEGLAAISHDLRTPIAQMRLRTELMRPSENRAKPLGTLDEMEAKVATFLDYARAAGGDAERRRCDIGTLVETICFDLSDTGAQVSWRVDGGLFTLCRQLGVNRGVTNLIDNALKYGQRAEVTVHRTAEGIAIVVEDCRPGMQKRENCRMPSSRSTTPGVFTRRLATSALNSTRNNTLLGESWAVSNSSG